jgi:hypothetical protein
MTESLKMIRPHCLRNLKIRKINRYLNREDLGVRGKSPLGQAISMVIQKHHLKLSETQNVNMNGKRLQVKMRVAPVVLTVVYSGKGNPGPSLLNLHHMVALPFL